MKLHILSCKFSFVEFLSLSGKPEEKIDFNVHNWENIEINTVYHIDSMVHPP